MADDLRLTQEIVQVELSDFDNELRATQEIAQVEVLPVFDDALRITQLIVQVEYVPEGTYPKRGASISIVT